MHDFSPSGRESAYYQAGGLVMASLLQTHQVGVAILPPNGGPVKDGLSVALMTELLVSIASLVAVPAVTQQPRLRIPMDIVDELRKHLISAVPEYANHADRVDVHLNALIIQVALIILDHVQTIDRVAAELLATRGGNGARLAA